MICFLDLDGVLADYYFGVCRAFGFKPWPYLPEALGSWNFFRGPPLNLTDDQVAPHMDAAFYSSLPVLPDAHRLVEFAETRYGPDRVYFLSSLWDTVGCFDGKLKWVKEHFPRYAKRMLVGSCKDACARSRAVLFDDSNTNCHKFREAGGQAVLVPRPWNDMHGLACTTTGAIRETWFDSLTASRDMLEDQTTFDVFCRALIAEMKTWPAWKVDMLVSRMPGCILGGK